MNIRQLCLKAGRVTLISNAYLNVKIIVKGMGPFWEAITDVMIDSIYLSSKPTAEKIIQALRPEEFRPKRSNCCDLAPSLLEIMF